MSLILEALRKLEKEKATADRGFVVLGAASWPAPVARRWPIAAVAVAVVFAAAGVWWVSTRRAAEVPSPVADRSVVSAPPTFAPAPVAEPLAPPSSVAVHRPRPERPAVAAPVLDTTAPSPAAAVTKEPTPAATPTADRKVLLQAISARDGRPVALLNDRLMGEGEEFEGLRVIAIRTDEVEVQVDGRRRILKF